MQAFNLRVGVGQPQCQGLPPSSLTLNGPQRASLDLTVNGASMRLGSNVTIKTTPDGRLRFLVTAGRLRVENGPVIPVGFATTVSLDENGDILLDSWDEVEPMTAEDLEELMPLEELPDDVLGEAYPLPSEDEIALLAALDFDLLLELDPYLAFALAEDWAANDVTPDDLAGATLDDLQAYVLDNLDFFNVDDGFLAALGDSFGLSDDDLSGLADELGIEFDPAALPPEDDGGVRTDDPASPDEAAPDAAGGDTGGGESGGNESGGESGGDSGGDSGGEGGGESGGEGGG